MPDFSIINNVVGINQGDNSSPKMSVHKGSLDEVPDENYDCCDEDQDDNNIADKPINECPKNFLVKKLEELKAKDFSGSPMARHTEVKW